MTDETLLPLGESIQAALPQAVQRCEMSKEELTLHADAARIQPLLEFLKQAPQCLFTTLVDVTAVDYPERPERFEVVYHLLSLKHNQRVRVKIIASESQPVPTAVPVFPAAGWFEREVWDMYGILFAGHPDLRRILTDYGFDGHPQRKDFPLTGYVELRYDEEQKRVVYEPVKLQQAFRTFDFESPWEGPEYGAVAPVVAGK